MPPGGSKRSQAEHDAEEGTDAITQRADDSGHRATDGHGRALAAELAARGATVLVHGRDDSRGRQAIGDIAARTGNDRLHWLQADLASLGQVRALAHRVAAGHPRLDGIVNNAGIGTTSGGSTRREQSQDGYELRFAVNYLACQ